MRAAYLFALCAACGDDGSASAPMDGNPSSDSEPLDTAIDAPPPNTDHRGLVQGVHIAVGTVPVSLGFFDVPPGNVGCTWTFEGECSVSDCASAMLEATSAGTLTVMLNGTQVLYMPDGMNEYMPTTTPPQLAPGHTFSASAAGATVPAFTSTTLTVPAPLTVTAPVDMAQVDHTQALTATWTAAAGRAYINISQSPLPTSPYPQSYARTIRCDTSSQTGTFTVPATLMSLLSPGAQTFFYAAAMVGEVKEVGDYEIPIRVIAADQSRRLTIL